MMADYYAHLYYDDPKAADEVEDDDFNVDDVARELGYGQDQTEPDPGDWEEVN